MNIKRKVLIVLALLMALLSSCHKAEQVPSATKGVITLNKLHDRNRFIVRLNGEWEFYWLKNAPSE